jgi:adenine deaminase
MFVVPADSEDQLGLDGTYKELACTLEYAFLFISPLSLGVIPALRPKNRSSVDGITFELLSPLAE